MGSKAILFLGLTLAMILFISSEVTARDLAETSTEVTDQYGGGHGGGGHGGGGYGGGGGGGGYGGGGGGGCRHGCCGHRYGRCQCCTYAGQKVDIETHN